jgi:spore coat protein U domain-containing protein, fimbrial subunit CupE1/2/3/6
MKRTVLSLIAVAAMTAPAFAASQSANLNVTASVSAQCTITTTPVAFGAYDPIVANAAADLTASGSVNVACTKGTAATIDLGNGGSFLGGTRRMGSGSDFLNYGLFKDAALSQAWGTGIAGGTTAAYNAPNKNVNSVTTAWCRRLRM